MSVVTSPLQSCLDNDTDNVMKQPCPNNNNNNNFQKRSRHKRKPPAARQTDEDGLDASFLGQKYPARCKVGVHGDGM